jgi:hypothetical protein
MVSGTPFIDSPGSYNYSHYYFEWEREWRHVGYFIFNTEEVAFLVVPESLHASAREFFAYSYRENTGPAYFCPFVDITWSRERILSTLGGRPVAAPLFPPMIEPG